MRTPLLVWCAAGAAIAALLANLTLVPRWGAFGFGRGDLLAGYIVAATLTYTDGAARSSVSVPGRARSPRSMESGWRWRSPGSAGRPPGLAGSRHQAGCAIGLFAGLCTRLGDLEGTRRGRRGRASSGAEGRASHDTRGL